MKKRLISLLLAFCMVIGILAGCSNVQQQTNPTNPPATQGSAGNQDPAPTEGEKELVTIKILAKGGANSEFADAKWAEFASSKKVIADLAELGIAIEIEGIEGADFPNVVQTRLASGVDIPDLVAYCWTGNNETDVLNWGMSGLVYDVNELVELYDEDGSIKAYYEEQAPGLWSSLTATDGNVYWFTYIAGIPNRIDAETGKSYIAAYPQSISIRTDWLEMIGEEAKEVYTPEELAAAVQKMQEQDVNGNSLKDEVIHVDLASFNPIAQAFGLNNDLLAGWYEGENEVFSNFHHENFAAYIEYMNSLFNAGLISPDSLSTSRNEMIAQNRAAVASGYAYQDGIALEDNLPDADATKSYYLPAMMDVDGSLENGFTVQLDSITGTSYCQYFVPKASEKAEAVVRLMDYIYTEEYAVLNEMGLEGKSWEYDENGNIVQLTGAGFAGGDDAVSFRNTRAGLYALPSLLTTSFVIPRYTPDTAQYVIDKALWVYDFRMEQLPNADQILYTKQVLAMPTEEESAFIFEYTNLLQTYATELLVDLIVGNKSLDNLDDYLKEFDELGLAEYIKIQQTRLDRLAN